MNSRAAAMTIEPETNRQGRHTVSIDAAARRGSTADWQNKIRFQFTALELPELAAVMLGLLHEAHFEYHGDDRKKHVHIYRKEENMLFNISHAQRVFTISVPPGSAYMIGAAVLEQMKANNPGLDGSMILMQIKAVVPQIMTTHERLEQERRAQARARN